jgi:hypothetical protein
VLWDSDPESWRDGIYRQLILDGALLQTPARIGEETLSSTSALGAATPPALLPHQFVHFRSCYWAITVAIGTLPLCGGNIKERNLVNWPRISIANARRSCDRRFTRLTLIVEC